VFSLRKAQERLYLYLLHSSSQYRHCIVRNNFLVLRKIFAISKTVSKEVILSSHCLY